jgi:DNA invertase Pin-like site-specific DNA recombinase
MKPIAPYDYALPRYIYKKNRLTDQEKKQIFSEGLTSKSTKQITQEQGVSRANLYRLMKRG